MRCAVMIFLVMNTNHILKALKCYGASESQSALTGIVALDQLPNRLRNQPVTFVVNTQKKRLPGKLWFVVRVKSNGQGEIFDSLGFRYNHIEVALVKRWMNNNCVKWTYNSARLQGQGTPFCGAYAIYYILHRDKFKCLHDFIVKNYDQLCTRTNDVFMSYFMI